MHVIVQVKKALPTKRPHLVVVDDVWYHFFNWKKDTMVFQNKHGSVSFCIETRKVGEKRYVRKMLRSSDGSLYESADAYRVIKKS